MIASPRMAEIDMWLRRILELIGMRRSPRLRCPLYKTRLEQTEIEIIRAKSTDNQQDELAGDECAK